MVKFKAICRDENDYKRKTNSEIEKVFRNPKPSLHPFQKVILIWSFILYLFIYDMV